MSLLCIYRRGVVFPSIWHVTIGTYAKSLTKCHDVSWFCYRELLAAAISQSGHNHTMKYGSGLCEWDALARS
jgi:hypothetical protein